MTATVVACHHALYRFYDHREVLLYIGLTMDPATRWKAHSKQKPWWVEVTSIRIEHFPSREAVKAAEIAAIKAELPLYNVVHHPGKTNAHPEFLRRVKEDQRQRRTERLPTVGNFDEWLLGDTTDYSDDVFALSLNLRKLDDIRLAWEPDHFAAIMRRHGFDEDAFAVLESAHQAYLDAKSKSGRQWEERAFALRADLGHEPYPRYLRITTDVAANVHLDRDNYFIGSPVQRSPDDEFLRLANSCARAGLRRIWDAGHWSTTSVFTSWGYSRIDLYVPLGYVNDAAAALLAAELDNNLEPLTDLWNTLTEVPVR